MRTLLRMITSARREDGATAVEYALIAGLIAVVIIVAVTALGNNLSDGFNNIADEVTVGE
jgi:pilus assembly protein Flp/PilA